MKGGREQRRPRGGGDTEGDRKTLRRKIHRQETGRKRTEKRGGGQGKEGGDRHEKGTEGNEDERKGEGNRDEEWGRDRGSDWRKRGGGGGGGGSSTGRGEGREAAAGCGQPEAAVLLQPSGKH